MKSIGVRNFRLITTNVRRLQKFFFSAGLSSSSVKHQNFFKTKVFATKIYTIVFGLLCILPENFNSFHQELEYAK